MKTKWFSHKIALQGGFWLAVVILASAGFLTNQSTLILVETFGKARHGHRIIEHLREVVSMLKDAEAIRRGYVLTGNEVYLPSFSAARDLVDHSMRRLRELTVDDADQQERLRGLESLVFDKLYKQRKSIELRQQRGFDAASQEFLVYEGITLMNQIRQVIGEMEHQEQATLESQEDQLQKRSQLTVVFFVLGNFASFGLLFVVFSLLNQEIAGRQLAEDGLQRAHDQLEVRVQERTADLARANDALLQEINEHQRADDALRESEERYRLLIEGANDMIQSVAADGRFLFVNRAWLETLGYTESELSRLRFDQIIHADSRAHCQQLFERVLAGESVTDVQATFESKDGRLIVVEGNAAPRFLGGEVVATQGFFRDVTERQRAEDSLHRLSKRLLRLQDEERRRIARELHDSTAQHLSAVTLNLALQQQRTSPQDDQSKRILEDTLGLTEQALREIRTLSYVLHPPFLDETGLASALRWFIEGFSKRSGIKVTLAVGPDVGRLSTEAETALFRVVQESLANVSRHSGSTTANVEVAQDADQVTVKVRDMGKGIHLAVLDEDTAPDDSIELLGVGITGMRERLRQLGGSLDVRSRADGTTVHAILPLGRNQK